MLANEITMVWGALGESSPADALMRPMVRGPHEVGGAEAGPERHSK
jgi:hypothetical protein